MTEAVCSNKKVNRSEQFDNMTVICWTKESVKATLL